MSCPNCGNSCSPTARFCGGCGAQLPWSCGSCGHVNDHAHAFCEMCGKQRVTSAVPATVAAPSEGERRHLTVMFCDLVGSTTMSTRLDPEELQAVVLAYQQACAEAIESNGGHVAHYMGDGILAYFGYPVASEQAAVQAARAGLGVVAAVQARSAELHGVDVRVGIHSGLTVVADMGAGRERQRNDVVGETPNIAARVQGLAEPGTVYVSRDSAALCDGYVELTSVGHHQLRGLDRPIEIFRVHTDTGARNRLDLAESRNRLSPFIGRSDELDVLQQAWKDTRRGSGRVVWVSGEPGIGKSRLVREFIASVRDEGGVDIELCCSQFHQASSLHAPVEYFRRAMLKDTRELDLTGVERMADISGTPRGLAVPVLADLLGIAYAAPYQRISGSADLIRRHTLEVVARLIEDRATQLPVLLVIEDLQWADATTLEMVQGFIGPDRRDELMTVVTHRAEFEPDVPGSAHHLLLPVDRLDRDAVHTFVRSLTSDQHLDSALVDQILDRTEGVPLFVEELTDLVLSSVASTSDTGQAATLTVPATLRDSLTARIDRLGPEVQLLRILSVFGREASEGLLLELCGLQRSVFHDQLQSLIRSGLVVRRGAGLQSVYMFKHALQQEVVYDSMLRSTRKVLHAQAADLLETRFIERTLTEPEMSARHFEMAGDLDRALEYLFRAGDRAIAISAHQEALSHLRHAIELIGELPASPERDAIEVSALVKLGVPAAAVYGYASPQAMDTYDRAQRLCGQLGDDAPVYGALYGLFRTRLLRAEYSEALDLAQRLSVMADDAPDRTALRVGAHRAMGSVLLYRGHDHLAALAELEAAIRAPDADRPGAFLGDLMDVVDPVVTCRSYAAWTHWLMGDAKRARHLSDEAIDAARRLTHPFTLGLALCFDTWLCQFDGDVEATERRAEEAYQHSIDCGFPFWTGWARVLWSWARVQRGDAAAVDDMIAGIVQWQSKGSRLGKTYFLGLVADAQIMTGNVAVADRTLDEALRLADSLDENFWLPELLRLRASIAPVLGTDEEVSDSWLKRASDTAHRQHAVALLQRLDTGE